MDQFKIVYRSVVFISIMLIGINSSAQVSVGLRIGPHWGKYTSLEEKIKNYPSIDYSLFLNYYWKNKTEYLQIESGVTRYGVQTDYDPDRNPLSYVDEFGHQYFDVLRLRIGLYFTIYQPKNKTWNSRMGLGLFGGKMINSEADLTYVFNSPNRPEERIREKGAMNLDKIGFREWIGGGDLDIDTGYNINSKNRLGFNLRLTIGAINTIEREDLFVLNNLLLGYTFSINYQYTFQKMHMPVNLVLRHFW